MPSKQVAPNYANHLIFLVPGWIHDRSLHGEMEFSQTSCTVDHLSNGNGTETHRPRIHDGNGVFIDVDFQHCIDDDDASRIHGGGTAKLL